MSLQFTHVPPLSAETGCESYERIVLLLVLLRNNYMATNLQMFTSSYDSRRSVARDC